MSDIPRIRYAANQVARHYGGNSSFEVQRHITEAFEMFVDLLDREIEATEAEKEAK